MTIEFTVGLGLVNVDQNPFIFYLHKLRSLTVFAHHRVGALLGAERKEFVKNRARDQHRMSAPALVGGNHHRGTRLFECADEILDDFGGKDWMIDKAEDDGLHV